MFTHGQSRVLSARPISPVHLILPDSLTALTQPLPPKHCAAQGLQAHLALLCMAADRALDALGVRGASGGPSYCCPPPAAPPHQQVPTWGRPIHEVGAVGRRGEVERGGGGMAGGRGEGPAHQPLPFIPPSPELWHELWSCRRGGGGGLYLGWRTHFTAQCTLGPLLTHQTALMHPVSSDSQLIPTST